MPQCCQDRGRLPRPDARELARPPALGAVGQEGRPTSRTFAVMATAGDGSDGGESVSIGFGTLPEGVFAGSPAATTVTLADGGEQRLVVNFGSSRGHTVQVREGAATAAVIVRPFDDDLAQHCDDLLAAAAGQARLFATSAQLSRFARLLLVQERLDQPRAGLMQGVARRLFDRFQVQLPALAPIGEDDPQEPPYFLADFLLDRFGRFFSADSTRRFARRAAAGRSVR